MPPKNPLARALAISIVLERRSRLRLHEGGIKKEGIVEFLQALKAHLKNPVLVTWDRLKAHRNGLVREHQSERAPPDRLTAAVLARSQSRGISVGLAQGSMRWPTSALTS